MRTSSTVCFSALLGASLICGPVQIAAAQQIQATTLEQLKYRHIGPMGNRVIAVVGVPGDPRVYYVGAASGGIFKSTDGGTHWKPIFDDQPVSSIGSLAVAPSDPNIIWAGTGETFIRSNISQGIGIFKSTDGGATWKHMGLEKTGRIGRIMVHPTDPDIVFAAALGHCYGPQQERGVFRTMDGGKNWERVLFVDEDTGAADIAMDPNNPRILFASTWQMLIRTWGRWSGGPGSGIYRSTDGGTNWERLSGKGLPPTEMGKIAVAVAPSDSNRVYALIETEDEGLWRSDNRGKTWKHVNHDHWLLNRPLYYTRLAVTPNDADEVYTVAGRMSVSLDGGEHFKRWAVVGGDHHDMWIDPTDPDRMVIGNDQGVSISVNHGETWQGARLPIAQMYHVAVDDQIPYYVYGNRQDGPSFRGPSNTLSAKRIPVGAWHSVGGCESGFAIPDPADNNIVWSGCYDGILERFDLRTMHSRSVSPWPVHPNSWAAKDVRYRFHWIFPIVISPHDHETVYVGSQHVHRTSDGGHSWQVISPDLSTGDETLLQRTGGITWDDASPTYAAVMYALAESPLEKGVIWAGTNDGLLHVTRNEGADWTNVTANIGGLPPLGTVSNIEPSRFDAGTCYVTFDFHQVNDRDPYVYKTTDYGLTWKSISSDIPKSELSYAHCIREDPKRQGLLYLGTENALYFSLNDGENWTPLQSNLPHAPVHWLTIQEHFNDLVVSTYGRGFWILDDVTPLQQLWPETLDSEVHLFSPRPAYRFLMRERRSSLPEAQTDGANPPYGASISYYLKSSPQGRIQVSILDEDNQIIRTFENRDDEGDEEPQDQQTRIKPRAGINRIWWDLRYERSPQIKLRTQPLEHPHAQMKAEGWREGMERVRGPLVAPGTYSVRLMVDGKEHKQSLVVRKDPGSVGGTDREIGEKSKLLLDIHGHIRTMAHMINQIESMRRQLIDLSELLRTKEGTESLVEVANNLDQKLIAVEHSFFDMRRTTGGYQDSLRLPDKLYTNFSKLAGSIEQSDYPATVQQIEVYELFRGQFEEQLKNFQDFLENDLTEFNRRLADEDVPHVQVPASESVP